ncbi:MAG TPA: protease inhibitor I42 family protein [Burkholderiales bacterium]|nr:protease inhibitor I42 family protein [Burkholderiales bacterium]
MADIVVTEADLGRKMTARVGDTVVVRLPENPTTGFRWALASPQGDVLDLAHDDFQASEQTGVGAGGLRVFRFGAKHAGSGRIELKLTRAWESGPPKAAFSVDVKVG